MVVLQPCGGGGRAYIGGGRRIAGARVADDVSVCVRRCARSRARGSAGWRVNRTLAPRRRLREARPRALAIERQPSPEPPYPPYPPSAPSFPRVTYRHPPPTPNPNPNPRPPRFISFSLPRLSPAPGTHTLTLLSTTTTTTTPLTLIPALLNYGVYIGTYRYVYLRTWTWRIYARRSLVYSRLSPRTQLYLRMSWIYRARERSR